MIYDIYDKYIFHDYTVYHKGEYIPHISADI